MGKFEGMTFQLVFNFFANTVKSTKKDVYFPPIFMSVNAAIREINVQSTNAYSYPLVFDIRKNETSFCKITLPSYYTTFNTTKFDIDYLNVYDQIDVIVKTAGIKGIRLDNMCVNILVTAGEKYSGDYGEEVDIILNSESRRIER